MPLNPGREEQWSAGATCLVQSPEGPPILHFPALFTDKPLSSLGEGEGVGQRAGAKVARGWACAWSQTVSKEYQTPGSVTLRTPAPTAVSWISSEADRQPGTSQSPGTPTPALGPQSPIRVLALLLASDARGAENSPWRRGRRGLFKGPGRRGDEGVKLIMATSELSCQVSEENCERREAFWAEWKDLTLSTRPEEG